MKKFIILLLVAVLLPLAAGAKEIGPNVSAYRDKELKWEDGAFGYHVMFKSLLENKEQDQNQQNPQGDTCKAASTYTLDMSHIPADAIIEDAYLIWTAAQPIAQLNSTTDNEVSLSFASSDGTISHSDTIKGKKAYKLTDGGTVSFEFDGFKDVDEEGNTRGWYTYRVKVLDFFKAIQEKGRASAVEGSAFYDGYSLLGDYTLSGLDCTEDALYKKSTELVADWSIVLIYSSTEISPKKIYMYDGFNLYWHQLTEIKVTGFVFPIDPEIRITLATHEGDPGLYNLEPESGNLVAEGIQVQGDAPDWLLLSNDCNPPAWADQNFIHLDYTEMFNSVSSVYGWNDTEPYCVGGIPPVFNYEEIEYGMDVDTFVMDSYTDGSYAAHFHKGGELIALRIGANQDSVITNYMIVSVDTKAPQFDIPGRPEKVACTPANAFDPNSLEGKWCQNGLEHTFALRIQNWGTDSTSTVIVQDSVPAGMEYVPGSTEYATSFNVVDGKKIATRWMPVPDNGGFPLETGFKVADSLNFCPDGSNYLDCNDMIMVRFRAKVKNETPKNQVIENTATYKSAGVNDYRTNLGIPVKLRMISAGCVNSQDAVDLSECGGVGAAACTKNEDCGEGYICDTASGACMEDPSMVKCQNSNVTASLGKNSPNSKVIFIGNPQTDLVIGQLEIAGSGENCYLNLDAIKLKVNVKDSNITISNLKMYKDNNSNGIVDAEDTLLASAETLNSNQASFSAKNPENRLWNNKKNNLLFTVDAKYKEGAAIQSSASFSASIEQNGGVILSDGGTPVINGLPVEFSEFQFEPAEGFIVTKGAQDPEVPAKSEMNRFRDILQIRVKANGADETIKKMTVKVPKSNLTSFGGGIKKLAVYEDTDNDGKGDTELAVATSFDGNQKHQFKFSFDVPKDTDKYLTIKAELALSDGETAQIQISAIDVNELTVLGLPVDSKPYQYACDPELEDCGGDDGGCSMVAQDDNSAKALYAAVAAVFALVAAFAFRMRKN